jgi:hypothetical protein
MRFTVAFLVVTAVLASPAAGQPSLRSCLDDCRRVFADAETACNREETRFRDDCIAAARAEHRRCVAACMKRHFEENAEVLKSPETTPTVPTEPKPTEPTTGGTGEVKPTTVVPSVPNWSRPEKIESGAVRLIHEHSTEACYRIQCIQSHLQRPVTQILVDGTVKETLAQGDTSSCLCGKKITIQNAGGSSGWYQIAPCKPGQ